MNNPDVIVSSDNVYFLLIYFVCSFLAFAHLCPKGWRQFGGHCYYEETEAKTQGDAETSCMDRGTALGYPGHLASVYTDEIHVSESG